MIHINFIICLSLSFHLAVKGQRGGECEENSVAREDITVYQQTSWKLINKIQTGGTGMWQPEQVQRRPIMIQLAQLGLDLAKPSWEQVDSLSTVQSGWFDSS